MSTTTTATSTEPTAARYQCEGCGPLTFQWGRQMPEGGRLGLASFGEFVNKPVQIFDVKIIYNGLKQEIARDWAFQAQDGSFLGRMYVSSPNHVFIQFAKFRPGDKWPQTFCVAYPTVSGSPDTRESVQNIK